MIKGKKEVVVRTTGPIIHPRVVGHSHGIQYDNIDSYRDLLKDRNELEAAISGNNVVEIGPGQFGGLAKISSYLGVSSYVGIDVNYEVVLKNRRTHPDHTFKWDDPRDLLPQLPPSVVFMAGLFDLMSDSYSRELADVIAEFVPSEKYVVLAGFDSDVFGELLRSRNFEVNRSEYGTTFCQKR